MKSSQQNQLTLFDVRQKAVIEELAACAKRAERYLDSNRRMKSCILFIKMNGWLAN
ncbi:hypothetical protein [Cloacibacillus porcorum]|uniref:hypothetical protein n=1 Tax=Cloacibacillus porcorum TaxID=1197717 RepID=UPI003D038432